MEKCAKLAVNEVGQATGIISEIPCEATKPTATTLLASKESDFNISGYVTPVLAIAIVALLLYKTFVIIKQQKVGIVERLGKYNKIMNSGLNFKIPFIDKVVGDVDLRIQQMNITVDTKTKDNVFVKSVIAVQYFVSTANVYDAFYKLSNPKTQIDAYVNDTVRSTIPTMTLDEVFESKSTIATKVKETLTTDMATYGYNIASTLVVDIYPDQKVVSSMNEINAQKRLKEAAVEMAAAKKISIIADAEADAESKRLKGEGVAQERLAIVRGFKESISMLSDETGVDSEEIMTTLMMTQYFDTIKEMGANKVILMPGSPAGVSSIRDEIRQAMITSQEVK